MPKKKKTGKRANGEGILRERSDGSWEARITIGRTDKGKLIQKSFYAKGQAEAKEKRDKYLAEVRAGTYIEPNKILFGDWIERHLTLFIKPKTKSSTLANYRSVLRTHIKPSLGSVELQRISVETLQEFYNFKSENLSSSSLSLIHLIVTASLKQAVRQRLILTNPADHTTRKTVKNKEVKPMTPDEVKSYLSAAREHQPRLYPAFLIILSTGLRRGEILALRWQDINFDEGILTVNQSINRVELSPGKTELVFSEPKTANSKREVPLTAQVLAELKAHKSRMAQERLKLGTGYQDNGLIFWTVCKKEGQHIAGIAIEPKNFLRTHKALLVKAGLRNEITVHTLRHTFATMLAQAGENPKTLQLLLGHSNVRTTLNTYVHAGIEDKRKAVERLTVIML